MSNEAASVPVPLVSTDSGPDIIVRADPSGNILYVSPSCASLGWTEGDLVGRPGLEMVHPDDRDRFLANLQDALGNEILDRTLDRNIRYLRKDGGWAWFEGNPQIVRDGQGLPIELVNAFRNVTRERLKLSAVAAPVNVEAAPKSLRRLLKPLPPLKPRAD